MLTIFALVPKSWEGACEQKRRAYAFILEDFDSFQLRCSVGCCGVPLCAVCKIIVSSCRPVLLTIFSDPMTAFGGFVDLISFCGVSGQFF